MKERPILFSGPMVRAILEGRKTQARRVVRAPTEDLNHPAVHHWQMDQESRAVAVAHSERVAEQYITTFPYYRIRCPYGQPGDRLWVRETWAPYADRTKAVYRASCGNPDEWKWTPSIHMPRWASRITLEITGVRVEQLQDISRKDAAAEGICYPESEPMPAWYRRSNWPEQNFAGLWDSINASKAPWSSNPWIWVVEFSLI